MKRATVLLTSLLVAGACSPASVTRIGPPQPSRGKPCDIEVLEPGQQPTRPYRDVGMVTLDNCQDYRSRPCRDWLADAACDLGGQVAYVQERVTQDLDLGQMRFRVMVGAYAGDWLGDPSDPLLRSRTCDPPCAADQVCRNKTCVSQTAPPCATAPQSETQPATRCTE